MFKKNDKHKQGSLYGITNLLSKKQNDRLLKSKEHLFYKIIFCSIKEELFASLYSHNFSRPNAPINALVSAIVLMEYRGWTYAELFDQIGFNILTRVALGLANSEIGEEPFSYVTIFNFQNRLLKHFVETGEDLIEQVFDSLTQKQLKALEIKTDIQRGDSFLAGSNIQSYSRIQLLIEMLLRFYRELSDSDKEYFANEFAPYLKQTSGQYVYRLKRSDLPHELDKIAHLYHSLYLKFKEAYERIEIFKIFERVYTEHFTVVEAQIEVKPSEELHSGCLQSPDDVDATYRKKRDQESRGQTIHFSETANPENELNLVSDVAVAPNNTDDSKILEERLEDMKQKTPDLDEYHTDGGYGSEANDKKSEELEISHVQTAVKGREAKVEIKIEKVGDKKYMVSCPLQTVDSTRTKKRHKVLFDSTVCEDCPLKNDCPAQKRKKKNNRVFYFTHDDYLRKKRQQNIETIPEDRRKLRPNAEATVREFNRDMPNKKLKVRGEFKTRRFAFARAIGINFGRIFRYITNKFNPKTFSSLDSTANLNAFLMQLLIFLNYLSLLIKSVFFKNIFFEIFHSQNNYRPIFAKSQKNFKFPKIAS
jgi:hypothetical protein